jgi:2-oxoglutarate dehydrogenase complex dehydrogenase (E1) component-like enzyme
MRRVHEQHEIRQSQQKQNIDLASNVLKKEIQKMHHPFWKLNKAFVDYIASDFMTIVEKVRDPKN